MRLDDVVQLKCSKKWQISALITRIELVVKKNAVFLAPFSAQMSTIIELFATEHKKLIKDGT